MNSEILEATKPFATQIISVPFPTFVPNVVVSVCYFSCSRLDSVCVCVCMCVCVVILYSGEGGCCYQLLNSLRCCAISQ